MKKRGRTFDLIVIALMAAIICIFAPISIPLPLVPITLGIFGIHLSAAIAGARRGTLSVVLYLLIGAIGLPVFSGYRGGFQQLAGPTGGYLVGFVLSALITGLLIDRFERVKWMYPVAMAAGTLACYLLGTAWLMLQTQTGFLAALAVAVVPFLWADALKIAVASLAAWPARKALQKYSLNKRRTEDQDRI